MIKYYELAAQALDLYEEAVLGESISQLKELLDTCLEDVNLDQITNHYRYSIDDSNLGYDLDAVGEFVYKFKQTYPTPLDIDNFIFDVYGTIYTNTLRKCLDKITHKEMRTPSNLKITDNRIIIDGNYIGTFTNYEQVRPGVLMYEIDKSEINKIINEATELVGLLRAMMVYDRYALKVDNKVISGSYLYKHTDTDKKAFEIVINQLIDESIEIPGISTRYDDNKNIYDILIDGIPVCELIVFDDEYKISYLLETKQLCEKVNQNNILLKYIDLVIALTSI